MQLASVENKCLKKRRVLTVLGGGRGGGGGGGGKVFSNQSHCRPVVTCSQTDKVALPDCSHPCLSYLTPPPKKRKIQLRGETGAPQPYPGKEMASYQIRLGSLFYGLNLYRGDKEMTHPSRTQRVEGD